MKQDVKSRLLVVFTAIYKAKIVFFLYYKVVVMNLNWFLGTEKVELLGRAQRRFHQCQLTSKECSKRLQYKLPRIASGVMTIRSHTVLH